MKTIINFSTFLILLMINANAQESASASIWVTFEKDADKLFEFGDVLTSTNDEIEQIMDAFDIYAVEQALPASKWEVLQKVYEVSCHCNPDALAIALEKSEYFSGADKAPVYELLNNEPDDYTLNFAEDYALDLIGAEEAWQHTTGDTTILLGVSDGSFFENHEDLSHECISIVNNLNAPYAYYAHGTAVSLAVAGKTNNNAGKSAIGYNCRLALNTIGYNQMLQLAYEGVRVVNVSWSSGCWHSPYYQLVIDEITSLGTIVVAAAGNGGTCGGAENLVYPASLDNVISVTSIGPDDNHERTIGDPSTTHQHNHLVDICAPGYDVALSIAPGVYMTGNGTSFASPYVTGTIGLMLSLRPCLSADDILHILQQTAVDIYPSNESYHGLLGAGRLDAGAAVALISASDLCPGDPNDTTTASTSQGTQVVLPGFGVMTPNNNLTAPKPGVSNHTVNGVSTDTGMEVMDMNNISEATKFEAKIYPNPSSTETKIEWNNAVTCEYRVLNTLGAIVHQGKAPASQQSAKVEVNKSGLYIVQIIVDREVVWSERFIRL